jgi:Uma2 family endonuclease
MGAALPAEDPRRLRMTYAEYLAWAGEDVHAEWVNGEVIVQRPPKRPHQQLVAFLNQIVGLFVAMFNLGSLEIAPFEVRLAPDGPSREPDLVFLARSHLDRLTPERITGAPDLIIEVVSDDSVQRDRVDKFEEYQAAGVPEYWVIDNRPERRQAFFYQLTPAGQYQQVMPDADGVYHSSVLPGFWLRLEWLWETEPDVFRALGEIIGPEQMAQAMQRAVDRAR